ncbi:MAG: phosphatidate cytidylyltransferase [Christensenellaceae bacterium]|nr:phosphatidate cytidylyltransferase [Christensenellaceae bacterium]
MKKTITGLLLAAVLLGFIFLTKVSQFFFDAIVLIVLFVALYEMCKLGKDSGYNPTKIPLLIMAVAIFPAVYFFKAAGYLAVAGGGFILIFSFFIFDPKITFKDFIYSVFIAIYPLLLLSLIFLIAHSTYFGILEIGMLPILICISAAMFADTFAFYFGSLIKGPKIFPKISPKKTYAGCIAGLFGGAAGALIIYALFEVLKLPLYMPLSFSYELKNPILFYALVGVLIAVISEIGDLGASRIKRELEIKDFSKILGSHGGIMDRLDSILFSLVPAAIITAFFV